MEVSKSCSSKKEDESSKELRDELFSKTQNELSDEVLSNESNEINSFVKMDLKSIGNKVQILPKLIIYGEPISLEISYDDKFKKKAEDELRETPEIVAESLKAIRELVKEDSNLCVPDHDEFFTRFLRPCKWYPESAFHLIQRHYQFRINYPHIIENLTPMDLKNTFSSELLVPLPLRCKDGERIILIHGGSKWKPKDYNIYELFRCIVIIVEASIIEPKTQIAGVQVIIDVKGLPFSHVAYFTPKFAAMVVDWVQRCLPCRLKHIHIINQPWIFNMIFAIFKPFLSEKLRKRIHFHGTNRENLINIIGKEALPTEYGGSKVVISPVGDNIWRYFSYWQEEFERTFKYGYVKNE